MNKKGKDDKFASIIKVQNYMDQEVRIKFTGGRQVSGILKGYDTVNNLILDDTIEELRGFYHCVSYQKYFLDSNDSYTLTGKTRKLGLIFIRGTMVI